MVDSNENILVEYDYDNITLIDPNRVVDNLGNVQERLVKQEDLVYYANLECSVLPRTKLAVGTALNDQQRTISVGKINFLNPGFKTFYDTKWSDELTGKDTLQGKGVNQPSLKSVKNPNKSDDYYITQSTYSNGTPGAVDTGLLGIKDINISMGLDFFPVVEMTLEDVKGRTLFEAGNNSPYAAFFQLPYPLFTLTLKGYYGKAIKYTLMLQSFTSNFDPSSHNFIIRLKFFGYKYTLLSYVNFGALMAVPHMYNNLVTTVTKTTETNQSIKETGQKPALVSRGYEKMKEIYSDYKSKGLIDDDFPEITLNQLRYRLDEFIKNILEQFTKENMGVLTDVSNYQNSLINYQTKVYFGAGTSWFNKYMDTKNPYITKNGETVYTWLPNIKLEDRPKWYKELEGIVLTYNKQLNDNSVLGKNPGSYTIAKTTYSSSIDNTIQTNTFVKAINPKTDIDWVKSYKSFNPSVNYVDQDDIKFKTYKENSLGNINKTIGTTNITFPNFLYFEGPGSFIEKINKMSKDAEVKKKEIEEKIMNNLKVQFNSKEYGLGFTPTIRNILAVFYCQGEAFLRLLDDVHSKAWDQRENPYRRAAIFGGSTTAPSVDVKTSTQNNEPIYPWPQVIKETIGADNQEKFEIIYPGAGDVATQYRAYIPEIWPEVEFVEEFIKGYTYRDNDFTKLDSNETNVANRPRRISLNSIDFPVSNQVFQNKQQSKYFYEIYERIILNAYYSKLNRISGYPFSVYNVVAENESINMIESLGQTNPYLSKIIKEYQIDQTNFEIFLRHISNEGQGESWQNFIRGNFVTPYIKSEVENPSVLYNQDILNNTKSQPDVSLIITSNKVNIQNYVSETPASNIFDFTDIYPITNLNWDKDYLANGSTLNFATEAFETDSVIEYNEIQKTITNFQFDDQTNEKRPISNFNYFNLVNTRNIVDLKLFYESNTNTNQFVTEGNLRYTNYDGQLIAEQTTSMMNTPYFINAIQDGVFKFRYRPNEKSPYKAAAYLFLESLPLATTKEKYKTYENGAEISLDYILSTLKKFGGVHELPYSWILKYGAIWHRYKTWIDTGFDFLDDVWKDFDYAKNYDPINSDVTKLYQLLIGGTQRNIVCDQTTGLGPFTDMNVGFYPQLMDDYNVFIQGVKLLSGSSIVQGVCTITGNTMEVISISNNVLSGGSQIVGPNISGTTTIISQVTGTTGGIGTYTISPSQSANTTTFNVLNTIITGPGSSDIQSLINNGTLVMFSTPDSGIYEPQGFDPSQITRTLRLNTWSMAVKGNTSEDYFVFPSFGANINQTYSECFKNGIMKTEVSQNKSVFNGSVRLYWNASQYGYFNDNKVDKSAPDQYFKNINNSSEGQENFRITGDQNQYSKIDEMFSAFDLNTLDLFEKEFLNFSKSVYDYTDTIPPTLNFNVSDLTQENVTTLNSTETPSDKAYKNFQQLMRELMKVQTPVGTTPQTLFENITNSQNETFQTVIKNFLDYNVVFKYGNPSGFDRRSFFTFSSQFIEEPISIDPYIANSLPGDGIAPGTTLLQSETQNPDTWKTLRKYVGFSEIPKLKYGNNGSYITDFFITMNVGFNEKNIQDFAPIIKIFATQKIAKPNLTASEFYTLMDEYLIESKNYLNNVLSILMPSVRRQLPQVIISSQEGNVRANLEAGFTEQTRTELWETFKTLNDTWISGYDFTDKTLFEDVLLLDRASRDVGNKILVDIFEIKDLLEGSLYKNTMLGIVESVLKYNNFVTYMLPSYINFYNVQNAEKNPVPRPDGSDEFANSMFGTFLNVDYRNSSPKYVCVYANKPSEHLAMNENIDYRYRDDAFDLRRSSDNPLLENQANKTDWARSNKVVGFNVDMTLQSQQIFKQFDVAQDPGKPTAESLEVLNQMANLSRNRRSSTQSVSLYNLYKNRSYRCSIDMMGNALIQPTMYFNIRNIPLFSGPYMITSVKHRISENGFDTIFEGIRQPFYSLPKIENFIQSLNEKILTSIQEQIQENETKKASDPNNIISEKNKVMSNINAEQTLTANQDCNSAITEFYRGFTLVESPSKTKVTFGQMKNTIIEKLGQYGYTTQLQQYSVILFTFLYVDSSTQQGFESYENNYSTIDLKQYYGDAFFEYINRKYYCVNRGTNINDPIVSFIDLNKFLDFVISKVAGLLSREVTAGSQANELAEAYVRYYPTTKNLNIWTDLTQADKNILIEKFQRALNTYNSLN